MKKTEKVAKNVKKAVAGKNKAPAKKSLSKTSAYSADKKQTPAVKAKKGKSKDSGKKTAQAALKIEKVTAPKKLNKNHNKSYVLDEKFPEFKGRKKKYFDLLIFIRDQMLGQIKFLSEEALDSKSSELAGSISNHMADYGSDNFLHDMELHMISDEGEVVEMIDEAIERLHSGEYGKCLECGCSIPDGRLEVKPYARFCVKCKSIREKNGDLAPG